MTESAINSIPEKSLQLQARLFTKSDGEASGLIFIEQIAAVSEIDTCVNPKRPFLLSWNQHKRVAVVWRPDCKMWGCPYCGEKRRKWVVARGYYGASQFHAENRAIGFVTLTSHERLNASGSLAIWPKAWDKLRKRLQRAVPGTEYMFVPELHKDGRMHAHGLVIDAPVTRWWKDNARACGMGFQSDMQEALDLGVVGYLAKYTGKMLEFSNLPKGTRRFRASQGWPKLPALESDPDVTTTTIDKNKPLYSQIQDFLDDGYDVYFEQSNNLWNILSDQQIKSS